MTNQTTNGKLQTGASNNPEKIKEMSNREIGKEYFKTQIENIGTVEYANIILEEIRNRKITASEVADYIK